MRATRLCGLLAGAGALATAVAPAMGATSSAKLWEAPASEVVCGVAIHVPGKPATQVLCSARAIPAPKSKGVGDPGFVFLSAHGQPMLARLSQDSFEGTRPVKLSSGSKWSQLGVTCTVSAAAVRCENGSGHGFTVGKSSYHAF